jgi:hypothetical protein
MFYLGDRLRFCCLLDRSSPLSLDAIRRLNSPLLLDENFPDWFLLFGGNEQGKQALLYFSRPHLEQGRMVQFRYDLVTNLNVFWFDTSKPEYPWHEFGPRRDFNPDTESVYVFRRTKL